MPTCFVSGHLDLSEAEFDTHYAPRLAEALAAGASFVVGDARGADRLAQSWLSHHGAHVTVYHMFGSPRNNVGPAATIGGFSSDDERDARMTADSDSDIAWVRPGRERSGTARNLARRGRRSNPIDQSDQQVPEAGSKQDSALGSEPKRPGCRGDSGALPQS